ncbi:hypothetical protein BDW66DRAFT_131634 [Aspergillus desertorum]
MLIPGFPDLICEVLSCSDPIIRTRILNSSRRERIKSPNSAADPCTGELALPCNRPEGSPILDFLEGWFHCVVCVAYYGLIIHSTCQALTSQSGKGKRTGRTNLRKILKAMTHMLKTWIMTRAHAFFNIIIIRKYHAHMVMRHEADASWRCHVPRPHRQNLAQRGFQVVRRVWILPGSPVSL